MKYPELTVKAGDEVAVEEGYSSPAYTLTMVKRVTPTGQIVVVLHDLRFDKDGREIGASGFRRRYLRMVTPEIRAKAMRLKISRTNWEKLSDEKIMQVAQVLGL